MVTATRATADDIPGVAPRFSAAVHAVSFWQRAVRAASRTEGRLTLLLALLLVLGVVAGIVGVLGVRDRVALLDGVTGGNRLRIVSTSGAQQTPAGAALGGYVSLTDADATAATAFLSGGPGSDELARYRQHIANATAALTVAATGDSSGAAVAALSNYLPVYTGQIEDAVLAYYRPGLPPGMANRLAANHLREPAVLARDNMLPAARAVYLDQTGRLATAQDTAATLPWVGFGLGVLLVGCLVFVQVYLTRRTRRQLNIGLVLATAAAVGAVVWLIVATASAGAGSAASRREGTAQIEALAEVRVAGLQARSDEAMTLIAQGNEPQYFDSRFNATLAGMTSQDGLLARARSAVSQRETRATLDAASAQLDRWLSVHRELRTLDNGGRHDEAITLAASAAPGSLSDVIAEFDTQLAQAVKQATDRLDENAGAARAALSFADIGVALLMACAVAGAVIGIWPRIAEYR